MGTSCPSALTVRWKSRRKQSRHFHKSTQPENVRADKTQVLDSSVVNVTEDSPFSENKPPSFRKQIDCKAIKREQTSKENRKTKLTTQINKTQNGFFYKTWCYLTLVIAILTFNSRTVSLGYTVTAVFFRFRLSVPNHPPPPSPKPYPGRLTFRPMTTLYRQPQQIKKKPKQNKTKQKQPHLFE